MHGSLLRARITRLAWERCPGHAVVVDGRRRFRWGRMHGALRSRLQQRGGLRRHTRMIDRVKNAGSNQLTVDRLSGRDGVHEGVESTARCHEGTRSVMCFEINQRLGLARVER